MSQREPLYECSKCLKPLPRAAFHEAHGADRKRPVTSQCRGCRSNNYFKRRYPKQCAVCRAHRALAQNEICRTCNEEDGLRECSRCTELLPVWLKFHDQRTCCVDCANVLRRLRRAGLRD